MNPDKIRPAAFAVQTLSAISIASLTILTGFIYAWPSYTTAKFVSNDTQLSEPMSHVQLSLFGSLANIGGMVATPFCGYALDKFGRKYSAILFGLPYVICWTMISLSNSVTVVLIAMALGGVGAAGQAISATYVCEIAQDSIRGGLVTTTISGFFFGLLISYVMGGYLSYEQVVYTHLTLSVFYMFLLMMLKESPVFLLRKGKEKEAEESIAYYRRVSVTSKEVAFEIRKLKLQIDPRIEEILHSDEESTVAEEFLKPTQNGTKEKQNGEYATTYKKTSAWIILKNSESSKRALTKVLILMVLSVLMGSIVLQVYAEPLMAEAAPSIPANLAAILLAVDFLFASLLCCFFVDRLGRKALMTYSSLASAVCTLALGLQLILNFGPHWVTVLIIYAFTLIFSVGAGSVPMILTAEVFLPEVRGLCNSIIMTVMWLMNFVTLIIFNPLVRIVGLGAVFCGFSVICLSGAIYSHYCLPETQGLSADNIQLFFLKNRRRSVVSAHFQNN